VFKEYTTKKFNHEFTSEAGLRKPVEPKILGQLIINHGYDYVQNILSDILEYDENYLAGLDWRELHATSQALQDKGRINDAIHTLLLSNKAFPGWYITNYELGRLYLKIGELDKSIISFKQALMDNPRHKESLAALKQLGITTPDYHDQKIDNLGKYFGVYVVDDERFREIYLENGELYLASNYWDKPVKLWPYTHDLFLVESDDPINNIQVLFNFDEVGEVNSLSIRGLNSGRINAPNFKKKE
jgi:tetratricopeptide (TPR) repeat protein